VQVIVLYSGPGYKSFWSECSEEKTNNEEERERFFAN
jgi:hypothetical protein